jgi:hypothetical protein
MCNAIEPIKYGRINVNIRIYKLISKIWNKEEASKGWLHSVICPVYKNFFGICSKCREITLLNTPCVIFSTLLYTRLAHIIETNLGDFQPGCRPNRSTVDNKIIYEIYEKYRD